MEPPRNSVRLEVRPLNIQQDFREPEICQLRIFHLPKFYPFGSVQYMVVRMKHTKGKRNRVRSHHALEPARFGRCPHCGQSGLPHQICHNCGWYGGRQVIDVLAKLDKKERKKKEKELEQHQHGE
jgi:large subunit ribosomal protein L32